MDTITSFIKNLFSTEKEGGYPRADRSLDLFDYVYLVLLLIFVIDVFVNVCDDKGARLFAKGPKCLALPDALRRKAAMIECSSLGVLAAVVVAMKVSEPFIGGTNLHATLGALCLLLILVYYAAARFFVKRIAEKHDRPD